MRQLSAHIDPGLMASFLLLGASRYVIGPTGEGKEK